MPPADNHREGGELLGAAAGSLLQSRFFGSQVLPGYRRTLPADHHNRAW